MNSLTLKEVKIIAGVMSLYFVIGTSAAVCIDDDTVSNFPSRLKIHIVIVIFYLV